MNNLVDFPELIKRVVKYMIEGFVVAIAAFAMVSINSGFPPVTPEV